MDRLEFLKEITRNLSYVNKWSASSLMKISSGALDMISINNFSEIRNQTIKISDLIGKLDKFLYQTTEKKEQQII